MVVPQVDVIPPLIRQQAGTIQPIEENLEPCSSITFPFVPSRHGRFATATALKKDLLILESISLSHLSSLSGANAMHPKVELGLGVS
jgi:hypothetical protein